MNASELRDIFVSSEFQQDLQEISSYLASIKQERPIIYALAKHLWKRRIKFKLEDKRKDLVVDRKRIEFKYHFDCDIDQSLREELSKHGDKLAEMWDAVQRKEISKSWGVIPAIYDDVCVKNADLFVWTICSRDLSGVAADGLERICWESAQRKYNARHPHSDRGFLDIADLLLEKLHSVRPFSLLKEDIETKGDFPSTYHFRICEFAQH